VTARKKTMSLSRQHRDTLKRLRDLVDGFVDENDRLVKFEDPVDIYRGYYGHLPEDPQ
jgi:hypothetical protein